MNMFPMLRTIIHGLSDMFQFKDTPRVPTKLKPLRGVDDLLGPVNIYYENGRRVIEVQNDVVIKFKGDIALCGEKSVIIQSGWRNSDDYKLDLNPEVDIETVFDGFDDGAVINIQNKGDCQCLTSSEKETSAQVTVVGDHVRTMKDPQTQE